VRVSLISSFHIREEEEDVILQKNEIAMNGIKDRVLCPSNSFFPLCYFISSHY
jgi:hypothetical protein